MLEYKQRNKEIALAILNGATANYIATQYSLSSARCSQLLRKYCFQQNTDVYQEMGQGPLNQGVTIKMLKYKREAFLDNEDEEKDDPLQKKLQSVSELPYVIVNELGKVNIHTLGDLLNVDLDNIKDINVKPRLRIGSVSMHIIECVIKKHQT